MSQLAREQPLFQLVMLFLVSVLAYGTVRHLTAHAAAPRTADVQAARALADSQGQVSMHVTDANADVGPGSDEALLAHHPVPETAGQ